MTEVSELINTIAERKGYSSYLEIGCFADVTFNRVKMPLKIGVDPERGGTRKMTSDDFFREYTGGPLDLIFIDGLHEREQVIRDVVNSLAHLNVNGGVILIDDCLPKVEANQLNIQEFIKTFGYSPPGGREWNGDVWKAMIQVRSWRDVESCTLDLNWGYGVIIRKPNTAVLRDIPSELDWKVYCEQKKELLRIVDEKEAFEFLGL